MDSKLLIWTERCRKPSGALTVRNVRVRFTWLQHWQAIHRRDCLLFGIYGRDVQEVTNMEIPEDVQEKLLRFARAGIAVATMKGKSYLSIGSVSMGIAGSIPNPDFFQEYLGMRNEYVDASEIERRVQLGIYDHEEFARAMAWTEKVLQE